MEKKARLNLVSFFFDFRNTLNLLTFTSEMISGFIGLLFYFALLAILVMKWKFISLRFLSKKELLGLFVLKASAAFFYLFVSKFFIKAGDIFAYFDDGIIIYEELLEGRVANYLQLTFGLNNTNLTDNIVPAVGAMGFWHDTSAYVMVRFNAFFDLFSFGNIYINALFFAFMSFMASVLLVKSFAMTLKTKLKWLNLVVFLSPTLLYWTSGMHKESLCVFLIALMLYSFLRAIRNGKHLQWILFCLAAFLLWFTRFFIICMLLPALLAYFIWYVQQKRSPVAIFTLVYSLLIALILVLPLIFDVPSLSDEILAKKTLYEALDNGNTAINLGSYGEGNWGIIMKVPQALFNTLIRPHFLDIHSPELALASIESFLISFSFLVSLFYYKRLPKSKRAFIFTMYVFSLSYLIITGLIVPNLGAILRYRSLALFTLIPAVAFLLSKKDSLSD